jgi:hypothetical protein
MTYTIEDDGGTLCVRHDGVRVRFWGNGTEKEGDIVQGVYSEHTHMVTIIYSTPNILQKKTYS